MVEFVCSNVGVDRESCVATHHSSKRGEEREKVGKRNEEKVGYCVSAIFGFVASSGWFNMEDNGGTMAVIDSVFPFLDDPERLAWLRRLQSDLGSCCNKGGQWQTWYCV